MYKKYTFFSIFINFISHLVLLFILLKHNLNFTI